ncbi:RNA-binding protein [Methanosphaera cuniculi]|uniref:RNA-binding protein n=1 Tax=Methanosphaera cuniculi TaxID=1077256 RepID=UPI0026EBA61E|nr:RNA-binding protein [Methanosphaera cuniculi]
MIMKTKKRNFLKNKKIKEIKNQLGIYENIIPKKSQVEYIKVEDMPDIYLIDGKPLLMQTEDKIIPTLKAILNEETIENEVVVDMGAINFVIKGADIMSPGIVAAQDTITEGDTVVIVDEQHHKPLAIGTALITGPEMVENNKGKAIKNLHYVGDPIWTLEI